MPYVHLDILTYEKVRRRPQDNYSLFSSFVESLTLVLAEVYARSFNFCVVSRRPSNTAKLCLCPRDGFIRALSIELSLVSVFAEDLVVSSIEVF
jgi:hypothetical protein